jgi:hypothetical protein
MNEVVKSYNGGLDWNVGSLFAHDAFMFKLFDVCKSIGIDVPIKYVFGSIPCVLQGGRIAPRTAVLPDALKLLGEYNSRGIGCRLTFSSNMVEKEELKDELCNELMGYLNEANDVSNGVIVSSDLLAEYIKETYPNLQVISSQVKPSVEVGLGNDSAEYYNKLFDLYDVVVVNPFKVNDGKFLNSLEHKDRVEFIANHHCHPNCQMSKRHYEVQVEISKKALRNEDYSEEMEELCKINEACMNMRKKFPLSGTSYSYQDIEMLVRMGLKHFKVEGRDNSGECFMRDLGDYVFNHEMYTRLVHGLMNQAV